MKNEKETVMTPEAEDAAKKHVEAIVNDPAPVTDAELDDAFAFETVNESEFDEDAALQAQGEWKFPGVRVIREPFMSKGKRMYSYVAKMRIPLKRPNGEVVQRVAEVELRVADKKNRDSYEDLDFLFADLPEDRKYFLLGFRYVEYSKSYSYCVQNVYDGVPVTVSLVPRDVRSQDNMKTIITQLRLDGRL